MDIYDDGARFWQVTLFLAFVLIAFGLAIAEADNCGRQRCPSGFEPVVASHQCVCVAKAVP